MKFSYHWLKELSGTKKSAEQVAKLLITHAFEVESVEKYPHGLENVVIGKVIETAPHPNADRLKVTEVEVGRGDVRRIVCGAPNVAAGQTVAVALPGARLPGGIEIQETIIREVASSGMICSARELGLGDAHEGILALPDEAPVGAVFAKYFGLEDVILDIKILPDRGSDALAYQGLAREIAALDGHAPRFVEKASRSIRFPAYNRAPKVALEDKAACLRYLGIAFTNVRVTESPLWLQIRLMLSGLRPINNIVDATNYLMLLTGQPMHAFDGRKLAPGIVVRKAKKNEKLALLSGETVKLAPDDLVIADAKQALALAGVMGGVASAISDTTTELFLEIANFDGSSVRRTRIRHRLPTDASYRFERGLDPNLVDDAAREAATLIATLSGARVTGLRDAYPKPLKPWRIRLPLARVESVLGIRLPLFEVVQYLALQGLKVRKVADQKALDVTVPTRRPDLRDEWDLIEEIGRMRGYDKILPVAQSLPLAPVEPNRDKRFERRVKQWLTDAGQDEVMTYSFYGEREQAAARLPLDSHLELENPLNPEQRLLRLSLAPLLLRKTRENLRSFPVIDCFEWGSVFSANGKKKEPLEKKMLALASVLKDRGADGTTLFALKGRVEALCEALHIPDVVSEALPGSDPDPFSMILHPTRAAVVKSGDRILGRLGELHPRVSAAFGLDARVAVGEFDGATLLAASREEGVFIPLPKYPYAVRDLSLIFPQAVTVGEAEALLDEVGAPLLVRHELFDIYGQGDEKSLAFHLSFGAADRTLKSEEMDQTFERIVTAAGERFGARLRL